MRPLRQFHVWVTNNQGVIQAYSTCFASVLLGVMSIIVSVSALDVSRNQADIASAAYKHEINKSEPIITSEFVSMEDTRSKYKIRLENAVGVSALFYVKAASVVFFSVDKLSCGWSVVDFISELKKSDFRLSNLSDNEMGMNISVSRDMREFIISITDPEKYRSQVERLVKDNFLSNNKGYISNITNTDGKYFAVKFINVGYFDYNNNLKEKVYFVGSDGNIFQGGDFYDVEYLKNRSYGKIKISPENMQINNEGACQG